MVWLTRNAIGKGFDYQNIGIRRGIDFHNFSIRNGTNFRDFGVNIRSGIIFEKKVSCTISS